MTKKRRSNNLNKAYEERDRQLLELKVDKTWDFVRDDPRLRNWSNESESLGKHVRNNFHKVRQSVIK